MRFLRMWLVVIDTTSTAMLVRSVSDAAGVCSRTTTMRHGVDAAGATNRNCGQSSGDDRPPGVSTVAAHAPAR
jgi:hypothetical protein